MAYNQSKPGTVITFYSYKGGTGRSMALVNIACLIGKQLLESSQKVLAVDWDLEAPGLHKFFNETQNPANEKCPGIINYFYALRDLLTERKDLYEKIDLYQKTKDTSIFSPEEPWAVLEKELPIDDYIIHLVDERGVDLDLDLIKAGQLNDPEYSELVNLFNWSEFYYKFGSVIDVFRELLASKYAYCLIDSRTGITDISGICTMLLPEKLVGVYTSNNQSIDGLIDVIRRAIDYRARSNDLRPLAIFPLASRIDDNERELQEEWRLDYQRKFEGLFREAYEIKECNLTKYFDEVKLPHKSYYSYGEKIAVLEQRNEALTLTRAYQVFFECLLGLSHAWQPLKEIDLTTAIHQPVDYDENLRLMQLAARGRTFVPNFQYDIFVSYARVDDMPLPGADGEGWVSTLVKGLKMLLGQKLGTSNISLWMDYRLSPNEQLTDRILSAVKQSATLVVILSPAYLKSEWYQRERNTFLQMTAQKVRARSRVFVVECDKMDIAEKPKELRDLLGYRFWVQDKEDKPPRTLGIPKPNPDEKLYYEKLRDLAYDLAKELERLKARSTVFLAEVTDDLASLRHEVREYLVSDDFRVLPETSLYSRYLSGSDNVQEVLAKELANCQLFVQLLSHMPGRHPPGQTSFPRLQYEVALKTQKRILQWRAPELKLNTVKDSDQRALLEGENVSAISLEEFKREVATRVKVQPTLPQEKLGSTGHNKMVFIDVDEKDLLLGKDIGGVLKANGIGYILPSMKAEPAKRNQEWKLSLTECDGLIIVYGKVPATWVKTRLLRSRRVIIERNQPLEALAICEGPHPEKESLGIEFPNMITINYQGGLDKSKLQPFLDALGVHP